MKDFFENLFEGIDKKKVLIFGPIVLIVIGGALWFIFAPENEEENVVEETVTLNEEEKGKIENSANNFVRAVGNFGFDYVAAAESGSIHEAKKVAHSYPNDENVFFTSRSRSYLDARENIAQDSPLYYPTTTVLSWTNEIELGHEEKLFTVEDVSFEIPETVAKVDFRGSRYDVVTVEVTLDSKVSFAKQTATDSSWDGTVNIHTKNFNDEKFDLRLIRIGDEWLPYDINNLENRFLLSTWKSPEFIYASSELSEGFEPTQTIRIEIPNGAPSMSNAPGEVIITEEPLNNELGQNNPENESNENSNNDAGIYAPAPSDEEDNDTELPPPPVVNPDGTPPPLG